jgi:hypothetical protein
VCSTVVACLLGCHVRHSTVQMGGRMSTVIVSLSHNRTIDGSISRGASTQVVVLSVTRGGDHRSGRRRRPGGVLELQVSE